MQTGSGAVGGMVDAASVCTVGLNKICHLCSHHHILSYQARQG